MTDARLSFELEATDGTARAGIVKTRRGEIHTPIFMPVGTLGTVKTASPEELVAAGAEIILGNTYHLYLRPGGETLEHFGGLHRFMGWDRPILTDSGGYQFFSLRELARFEEDGVVFRSHLDGSEHRFTPESCIAMQRSIGSDIMMVLDQCPALPATPDTLQTAVRRSTDWAVRCLAARRDDDGALFAIAQGGTDAALRTRHALELAEHPFEGLALGGLAVGESPEEMYDTIEAVCPAMPDDRPRYLMGVGRPQDIIESIARGIDMLDCVMPTRNARNAQVFTRQGRMNLRNARFARDARPLDESCDCPACRRYTRGYIHHLVRAREVLGIRLTTLHNLHYYLDLVRGAREAVFSGAFDAYRKACWEGWRSGGENS